MSQRKALSILLLATFTAVTFAQGPGGPGGGRGGRGQRRGGDVTPPKLECYTYEQGSFKSDKAKDADPGYAIFLPKGYAEEANKDTKYPWAIWLHGFGGFGEFQQGGGAQVLDQLRKEEKIPPMAVVVFRAPGFRTTYLNGESGGDIEDIIIGDLLKHLQEKYRLKSERDARALMGVSMGGMGALKIAMHHPDVFGAVAVHSAAILPVDPADLPQHYQRQVDMMMQRGGLAEVFGNPIDKKKWAHEMPLALAAETKPADLKGLKIYFDAGTEDRYGFCAPNEQLDKVMTEHGIQHAFTKVEGGGHAWSSPKMKENLTASLQFVGASISGKDPMAKPAETKRTESAPEAAKEGAKEPAKAGEGK